MSGTCGLVLYLQLQILVKSSAIWFQAHHWAIGADSTPRILQGDGSFAPLTAGRRACQLPDFSLSLLSSLLRASEHCGAVFADEYTTMDAMLPSKIADEMKSRPPKAYKAAIKKYTKHAVTYQMLPWSLARITEDSGPVFLLALLCMFFPVVATRAGVVPTTEPDSDADEYHAALQDTTDPQLAMRYLSTVEEDLEIQLCHERLLEMATEAHADSQYKAVIAVSQWHYQAQKEERGSKRAKGITNQDKAAARAARAKSLSGKECFSLGFLELCQSPTFMDEVVRVAQTGMEISSCTLPAVKWGQQCNCKLPVHKHDCWTIAKQIYQFTSDNIFHFYVHQMLAEGIFNMHDHNKANVTPEFIAAGVNMKVYSPFLHTRVYLHVHPKSLVFE